jgi:hypothetical protein
LEVATDTAKAAKESVNSIFSAAYNWFISACSGGIDLFKIFFLS